MDDILRKLAPRPSDYGGLPGKISQEDDAGNVYDDTGRLIFNKFNQVDAPDTWGQTALDVATAPAKLATGMVGSLSPYGQDGWQVPPIVSEPIAAFQRSGGLTGFGEDGRFYLPNMQNPQSQQDAITQLLTFYGGNALSPKRFTSELARNHPPSVMMEMGGGRPHFEDVAFSSKNASIFDPPDLPQRPFEAEYPTGAQYDAAGRLTHDIDGRPLRAKFVAGRTVVGGGDEAIPPAQFDALAESLFGTRLSPVASGEIRGDAGRFQVGHAPDGTTEYRTYLSKDLPEAQRPRVAAHEIAHGIDYLAGGGIPQTGILNKELKPVYNSLNNPNRARLPDGTWGDDAAAWAKPVTPDAQGYKGEDIAPEYMAEAIRAYMANPNYIKTVAPKTAARIREYVSGNDRLNSVIQFNSDQKPSLLGSALASLQDWGRDALSALSPAPEPVTVRGYHGTRSDVDKFNTGSVFASENPDAASAWAMTANRAGDGPNVMPLDITASDPYYASTLFPDERELKRIAKRDPDVVFYPPSTDYGTTFDQYPGQVFEARKPGTVRSATTGEILFSDNKPSLLGALASAQDGGLPMDQASRLARAKEMGFDTDKVWHNGSYKKPDAFDLNESNRHHPNPNEPLKATWFSPSENRARWYANSQSKKINDKSRDEVDKKNSEKWFWEQKSEYPQPLPGYVGDYYVNPGRQLEVDASAPDFNYHRTLIDAQRGGYDSLLLRGHLDVPEVINGTPVYLDELAMLNPANIRSVNAAFDPARAGENGLLLSDNKPSLLGSAVASTQGETTERRSAQRRR